MVALPITLAFAAFFASSLADDIPEAQQRFYDVNTQLCGIGIKQWYDVDPMSSQISTAIPLTMSFIQLSSNSNEDTQNEILGLLNQTSLEAITVAKAVMQNLNTDSEIYTSELKFKAFADKNSEFTDTFQNGFADVFNGTVENLDYSDGDSVAKSIKDFLGVEDCSNILNADNFTTDRDLIIAASTKLKFNWGEEEDSYRPYKQVDVDFTAIDGTVSTKPGWYAEGAGKYAKIDEYDIEVFQFALKGGLPVLMIRPTSNDKMKSALSRFSDPATMADILTKTEDTYLKLNVPVSMTFEDVRDYVPEVKMANLLVNTFENDFDGFSTVFENKSGFISYMLNHLEVEFPSPTEEQDENKTVAPDTILNSPFFYFLLDQYNTPVLIGLLTS